MKAVRQKLRLRELGPGYADALATWLRALAHPIRLQIVYGLSEGKCNVCGIAESLGLRPANVSQHLASLRRAGIVQTQRRGQEICYRVADTRAESVVRLLLDGRDSR